MESANAYRIERSIIARDIEVGDILVYKDPIDFIQYLDMRFKKSKTARNYLLKVWGEEIEVTQEIFDRIKNGEPVMQVEHDGETVDVITDYVYLVKKERNEARKKMNIVNKDIDESVIEEMVKKVDRVRFKKLLVIAARDDDFNMGALDDAVVDSYLNAWARAKYNFYILFGRNLKVEKEIEFIIDEDEMAMRKRELQREYPKWANLIYGFSTREFMDNECYGHNGVLRDYYSPYRNGAKLSKVVAGLTEDDVFMDALAGVLDGRIGKGVLALSIDPFDYMTSSLNMHGWTSCQDIAKGCYPTGSGAILLDKSSVMAYRHTGTDVTYTIRNMPFVGNSKSWRQIFYIDASTSGFVTGRPYPSYNEAISQQARELLEEIICNHTGIENRWVITRNSGMDYRKGSGAVYHDLLEGRSYVSIRHKHASQYPTVVVGEDVPCLICGAPIDGFGGSFLCSDCYDSDPF